MTNLLEIINFLNQIFYFVRNTYIKDNSYKDTSTKSTYSRDFNIITINIGDVRGINSDILLMQLNLLNDKSA